MPIIQYIRNPITAAGPPPPIEFPDGYTLWLDFENGEMGASTDTNPDNIAEIADINAWLPCSRSSGAYAYNADGTITSFSANVLRVTDTGLMAEFDATNLALWCRDWTQASYSATNVTRTKDQTGVDNVVGEATRLTATATNGTITQPITSGSATHASTCYVKRLTGTGTIEFTDNGGTNWIDITSNLSGGGWYRALNIRSQANPNVGFRIGTSGDEIAVDFLQCETDWETTPILTTSSSATRAKETITGTNVGWAQLTGPGTFGFELYSDAFEQDVGWASQAVIRDTGGHSSSAVQWQTNAGNGVAASYIYSGGTNTNSGGGSAPMNDKTVRHRSILKWGGGNAQYHWKVGDNAAYQIQTDASVTMPVNAATNLDVAQWLTSINRMVNMRMTKLFFRPDQVSDAEANNILNNLDSLP